jgi:RHS repeat-associated protein
MAAFPRPKYGYGTTLTTSDVARNDVLSSITYSDGGLVGYLVNRQSQVKQLTDQNDTQHAYTLDLLGRLTLDDVTLQVGGNIDDRVLRLGYTYEVRGMLAHVTSYSIHGGFVVSDVLRLYNNFRQLATEYQEHNGAVNTSTSLNVQYAYAGGTNNTIRRTGITYPGGSSVSLAYNSGLDDALNRVSSIGDSGGGTNNYTRIGGDTIVQADYVEPGVSWSLINGTGSDPYTGLDQFNRLADSRWFKGSTNTDLDRIQHGYDLASNRMWRRNTVADAAGANLDELYGYDGLYRLAELLRGELNASNSGIVGGTASFTQAWGLDATGNWRQFDQADSGGPLTLAQTRSANSVNEITSLSGGGWPTPTYDAAGNMTSMPLPRSPATSDSVIVDAWNRLISNTATGEVPVNGQYYDGLGRRINKTTYSPSHTRDYFYSDHWQPLEERLDGGSTADRLFVWGPRYIDDLVLRECSDYTPSRLYALQDPNWNVTALCDTSGTVQERYAYAAYGQPMILMPDFGVTDASAFAWETLFAGYRFDSESGLYCVRHRHLHPLLGVWVTRDPIMFDGSANLFAYVNGGPTRGVDPSGADPAPAPPPMIVAPIGLGILQTGSADVTEGFKTWLTVMRFIQPNDPKSLTSFMTNKFSQMKDKDYWAGCNTVNGQLYCGYFFPVVFACNCNEIIVQKVKRLRQTYRTRPPLLFQSTLRDLGQWVATSLENTTETFCEEQTKFPRRTRVFGPDQHGFSIPIGGNYMICQDVTVTACCGHFEGGDVDKKTGKGDCNKLKCSGPEYTYSFHFCFKNDGSWSFETKGLQKDVDKSMSK